MAFLFASASTQYLLAPSAPLVAEPITMSLWFRPASLIDGQCLLTLGASAGNARYQISANASSNAVLVIKTSDGSTSGISTNSTSFTVGQWMHIAAVFSSTTNRIGYVNGTAGTANTTSITTATPDRVVIGARLNSSFSQYTNGDIAEVAVWDQVLNADEIAGLSKGLAARFARPSALVWYSRLIRNAMDIRGGRVITNTNGATASTHPRIIHPC
jgi:hypothetical protein